MKTDTSDRYDFRLVVVLIVILSVYVALLIEGESGAKSEGNGPVCQRLDLAKSHLVSVDCNSIVDALVTDSGSPDTGVFFFTPIPINSAGFTLLQTVKGVGPKLAGEIIEYRERFGLFSGPDSMKKLTGVGEKRAEYLATQFNFE